jgi:hypothetical protein
MNKIDRNRFVRVKEKSKQRFFKAIFLIVCEGEKTEPNYFKKFDNRIINIVDVDHDIRNEIECVGIGSNTLRVVEKAITMRDAELGKYDRVWAVFDKDSFPDENFNNAIDKAMSKKIGCAWSNEAFELWYLLHFYYRDTGMSRNEYKKVIEKAVGEKMGAEFKYEKNSPNMYDILNEYGNQVSAIKNAEKLMEFHAKQQKPFAKQNPATMVYKLVEELIGRSDDLNNEIKTKVHGNANDV